MSKDKQVGKEESFKEYVRKSFEDIEKHNRQFSMNLGAVARTLNISPKKFVKALYEDQKNNKFYINVIKHEQKRMQKLQGTYVPWYKKLFKRKDNMARQPFGSNQPKVDTETQAKIDDAKVTLANAPESATGKPVTFEGLEVVAILQDGRENATHYHCSMSNGTQMHVPKTLWKH